MAYSLKLNDYRLAFQEARALGEINISRGQLWLRDPFYGAEEALPFLHPVPSGRYPIEMALKKIGDEQRLAWVRILFQPQEALYFELGLTAETLYEDLGEDEFCGAVCETGYLCLSGQGSLLTLEQEQTLWQRLQEIQQPTYAVLNEDGHLYFSAGWGAGVYPLFFGYSHEPREDEALLPVCAVLDLGVTD